jgi:hypothetical protein
MILLKLNEPQVALFRALSLIQLLVGPVQTSAGGGRRVGDTHSLEEQF